MKIIGYCEAKIARQLSPAGLCSIKRFNGYQVPEMIEGTVNLAQPSEIEEYLCSIAAWYSTGASVTSEMKNLEFAEY